ncbi:hypothetical protein KEM60_00603 [Austwickia sp. TVS 96-490-7B]|uniref:hypothetical protein n=1 Tax=Austwickia sp. TVS 96-490-7B TaxID=2830843 RepID=UPI001C58EAF7|nr:hypothetical protein [Austwickia sp. TVS 96-490-7B]MBW3084416.1 hypothetical protein [Austwickia sp. TVS 96-490-7B]
MAYFVIQLNSPYPPELTWTVLWDLRAHDRIIPLTRLRGAPLTATGAPADAIDVGVVFTAWTTLGPWSIADPMRVEHWVPPQQTRPGRALIVKTGQVVTGNIEVTVAPRADLDHGATVHWAQQIDVRGVPAALDPLTAAVAQTAYRSVVTRLIAAAAQAPARRQPGTH